jgi:hypothetical protein
MNISAGSKDAEPQVSHVEQDAMGADGPSSSHMLNDEQIRDQMAAHVRLSKLRFTSWSSIQLYIFFFVSYCSKLFSTACVLSTRVSNLTQIPGGLGSIAL